jgi:hypothetical protein
MLLMRGTAVMLFAIEAIAEEVKKQTPRPIAKKLRRQQPK